MQLDDNIYQNICSEDNLILAFNKAGKGKSKRRYVKRFKRNLKKNILKLSEELLTQTYKLNKLKTFTLRDPKTRKISKSAFRDRVVYHALCNLIIPILEKSFIYDSYANQIGKGTLKALERFDYFKRKVSKNNTQECFVLKADIKHYFQEVDHEVLIEIIKRKITDEKVIWLIRQILANTPESLGGGGRRVFYLRGCL
ncbi:MAG: reverse transcriptase domain-containing protein [Nanoarchaeota archaeon]|nr:reverse transcriptase domain-containing protein [Nanoarchaeota archaeon]